ncbi:ABC transporter substrate-binding protein [Methylobacterium phyllosphaerae]
MLAAFIRDLATEYPLVRLVPVPKEDLAQSAKALMSGEVDLAVVRSDNEAAAHGRTLFVLRQIGVAVLLPPEAKIEKVSELAGKKIAVASGFDPGLLKAFAEFYGLRKADLIEMPLTKFGSALKAGVS